MRGGLAGLLLHHATARFGGMQVDRVFAFFPSIPSNSPLLCKRYADRIISYLRRVATDVLSRMAAADALRQTAPAEAAKAPAAAAGGSDPRSAGDAWQAADALRPADLLTKGLQTAGSGGGADPAAGQSSTAVRPTSDGLCSVASSSGESYPVRCSAVRKTEEEGKQDGEVQKGLPGCESLCEQGENFPPKARGKV